MSCLSESGLVRCGFVASLATLALAGRAHAQDADPAGSVAADFTPRSDSARAPTDVELADAAHSFEVATAAYGNGDYETAAEEFRAAHAITGHPELLFNIYLAEERAGRPAEAAQALAGYLSAGVVSDEERVLLQRRLERLEARAASRAVTPPEDLDEHALLPAPADGRESSPPTRDSADALGRHAPEPPPPAESPSGAGIGTLVAGGVLLVAFAVLAPLSEVEDQRLASSCGRDAGRTCSGGETTTLTALNVASDVSWIAGAALAVTGVVLMLVLPPDRAPVEAMVVPWVMPDGVGVAGGGTF